MLLFFDWNIHYILYTEAEVESALRRALPVPQLRRLVQQPGELLVGRGGLELQAPLAAALRRRPQQDASTIDGGA